MRTEDKRLLVDEIIQLNLDNYDGSCGFDIDEKLQYLRSVLSREDADGSWPAFVEKAKEKAVNKEGCYWLDVYDEVALSKFAACEHVSIALNPRIQD